MSNFTTGEMSFKGASMKVLLEAMDEIADGLSAQYASADSMENPVDSSEADNSLNYDELIEDLNTVFTPVLVMQELEGDVSEKVLEACSEDNVLSERSCLQFDDKARMAQLLSVCALLIARQKNSPKYEAYRRGMEMARQAKMEIQREEPAAAQALAQKYLVKVSTTNGSSIARKAAENLLPLSN